MLRSQGCVGSEGHDNEEIFVVFRSRVVAAPTGGHGKELRLSLRLEKVLRRNVVHMDSAERSAIDAGSLEPSHSQTVNNASKGGMSFFLNPDVEAIAL